jgi:hypothetical protein
LLASRTTGPPSLQARPSTAGIRPELRPVPRLTRAGSLLCRPDCTTSESDEPTGRLPTPRSASPGNTRHRGSKCFLCLATSHVCARGDLNRARPTLVMLELASLSVE